MSDSVLFDRFTEAILLVRVYPGLRIIGNVLVGRLLDAHAFVFYNKKYRVWSI